MTETISVWNRLEPDTTQVLLCDLQKQLVVRSNTTKPDVLRKSAGVLLKLAKLFSLPTVLSVVPEGGKAPDLIPELRDRSGFAQEKPRASASPLFDQATVSALATNGRKVLVVAGFVTEVVVLHAALDAIQQGYAVLVPVDACGGMSERTEQAAFRQIEAAGAITTSVTSIGTKLAPDFTTDKGKQMFALVQQIRLS